MFIGKIILNNFRIFRGKHEFDFSNKKVIIVEGPNGHGKSTIFDAINWVISGKIFRYVGSSEHQQFNYIINNDAFLNGVSEASVEISFNNGELVINRTLNKNGSTKLYINGQEIGIRDGQKEIVQLLANEKILSDTNLLNSIDLLSFIESTLILSQENLEEFVRGNKPTERYSKLEQILGLTRYGRNFKNYLQELRKEYSTEYNDIFSKREKLKHKQEILNAEYQPKLQQSERNGNKPKSKIIDELNIFGSNLQNYSLKIFKSHQNFQDISINEYNYLKKYFEAIEEELKSFDLLKFEIEQQEIYVNELEFNEKSMNLKHNITTLKGKKFKREKGIEKAYFIIGKLNDITSTNKYLDVKKIEKEQIKIDIKNIFEKLETIAINTGISHIDVNYAEISSFIKEFKFNNDLLDKIYEKKSILEDEYHLKVLAQKEKSLETEFNSKSKLVNNLQNEIKTIDKQILDLNNRKKINLDSQIYTIIHEVQTHLINSDAQNCLVCGSPFNNSEELKESIGIQLEESNNLVNGLEKALNEYKVQKNNSNVKLEILEQELKVFQQELNDLRKEIRELNNKIVVERLNNPIDIEDINHLKKEMEKVQTYKKNNDNKYSAFIEMKKGLDLLNELNLKRERISEEEKKIIEKHNSYKQFIGDQRKIELKLIKVESYIDSAKIKIQEYDRQGLELNRIIQDTERQLKQLIHIKSELEKRVNCELALNSSEILEFIIENISLLKNESLQVKNLIKTIEIHLDDIKLRDMESKIKDYDQENIILKKQIEQYLQMDKQLENLITYHTEIQSSLVNEYLNGLSKAINDYFRQISPHSYFNYINLITKRNELFILLKDNPIEDEVIESETEGSVNASLTLSAAQSTILAMSIFLALNKSQNWSKLNVIGIDDPFQNLDDINAYSFIDVISNLVSIENRQVLISTHDSDFASLSIRKMNLNPDDYAYIKIQSYTRDAIEVQSEQYRLLRE